MKKQVVKHPLNEPWKDNFRNSSMRIGFSLILTKTMLEYLCAVADDVKWDRALYWKNGAMPDNWIASERSLEKRGLIERKPAIWFEENKHLSQTWSEACERSCCVLTPAGKAVVELIKIAGIFVEADAAINKKSRKRA